MKRNVYSSFLTTCSFVLLLFGCRPVSSEEHVVYWNSSNLLFRNRQPTIEVRMGDLVRFVCPDNEGRPDGEYLTVYEVTEFASGDCSRESDSREVISCGPEGIAEKMLRTHQLDSRAGDQQRLRNQKTPPKNVAQLIRHLNPLPNGKEYQVGQTYYYMTTSTGKATGLNHQMFGLCQSHNMRLFMKVTASQPPAHPVKPMAPTRRQEDFVTKSSAERGQEEDEDSEIDSAHLLPRATNPKFRRPSQLEQAAASAGVRVDQLDKVVQMAKEGRTGTFENERREESRKEKGSWDPVNVQYMADLMNNAYQNAEDRITYQREPDFEIHEDNDLTVKSLEYSSSTASVSRLIVFAFVLIMVFF